MMRTLQIVSSLFILLYAADKCNAQPLVDTAFVTTSSVNAVKSYHNFIQGQAGLYIGSEYRTPDRTNQDHPFYRDFDWLQGSVFYSGETYDDVSLLYDLTTDDLVTEHFYNADEMVLVKAKVEGFIIGGDEFIHVTAADSVDGLAGPGFYQLLYDGPSRVVARHVKLLEEKIESNTIEKYFTLKTKCYLWKDGEYHRVSKRNEVFRLFEDKKQALRSYAADRKIKISKKNPKSFALIAQYYDSLKSSN